LNTKNHVQETKDCWYQQFFSFALKIIQDIFISCFYFILPVIKY
jgi:hypothetical protein